MAFFESDIKRRVFLFCVTGLTCWLLACCAWMTFHGEARPAQDSRLLATRLFEQSNTSVRLDHSQAALLLHAAGQDTMID